MSLYNVSRIILCSEKKFIHNIDQDLQNQASTSTARQYLSTFKRRVPLFTVGNACQYTKQLCVLPTNVFCIHSHTSHIHTIRSQHTAQVIKSVWLNEKLNSEKKSRQKKLTQTMWETNRSESNVSALYMLREDMCLYVHIAHSLHIEMMHTDIIFNSKCKCNGIENTPSLSCDVNGANGIESFSKRKTKL